MTEYRIDEHKLKRFTRALNSSPSVQLIQRRGISFVTVNSMAFEGDDCFMCYRAVADMNEIQRRLSCSKVSHHT